jgi:hypothetical protein
MFERMYAPLSTKYVALKRAKPLAAPRPVDCPFFGRRRGLAVSGGFGDEKKRRYLRGGLGVEKSLCGLLITEVYFNFNFN